MIIDTHAHLDMSQFDYDRDDAINRARDTGVGAILTVGIDMTSSLAAIKLAEAYEEIYASIGFHPHEASKLKPDNIKELTRMAKNSKVVAIGEIGLDYYRNASPRESQIEALKLQLELAAELELPVIIHCRQAEEDMLGLLETWADSLPVGNRHDQGVIHCFNGDVRLAEKYLNKGFYIAFGAYIGYPSSRLSDTILSIPPDRLLVETDCPFLPPQTHRGKRNEPSYLPGTVGIIALTWRESFNKIAEITSNNARKLFNFL